MSKKLTAIIMAAGKGTRMKSQLPKVLHKIAGKTMLDYVFDSVRELNPEKVLPIVGYKADVIKDSFDNRLSVEWVEQKEQLGTGHAVMQTMEHLKDYDGDVLILSGDVPLLSTSTLQNLLEQHRNSDSKATILTTFLDNPFGYGRIIKNDNDNIVKIVEEKDATNEERKVNEINSGTYCFDWKSLSSYLEKLTPKNAQGEYYLTDIIKLFVDNNLTVKAFAKEDSIEVLGVNDRVTLAKMAKVVRERINTEVMLSGVTLIDPETTYIDAGVKIAQDTIIYPNTIIEGHSTIGSNSLIGPDTRIVNSSIGDNTEITYSSIYDSKISHNTTVGPYARLRNEAEVGENCKIGNFVELKKTVFETGVKASHLAYIGDAEVGKKSNIGAGTITCNYDGKNKHKTIMGENVFVGSNSTLVAPLILETDTYIAAGSVITEKVPTNALGVGRSRQRNVENWLLRKKGKKDD